MNIRNGKSIAAIAICLVLGTNVMSYASTTTGVKDCKNENHSLMRSGFNKKGDMPGILERLGISKQDLDAGIKSGKTLFDIAKEKGHSESEVKNMMIEEKIKYIDSEVQKNTISKEKGEEIKTRFKDRIQKWDGHLKDHKCNKDTNENSENNNQTQNQVQNQTQDKEEKAD